MRYRDGLVALWVAACAAFPATADAQCVDKVLQTIGQCTGCTLCDTHTPDGYCACSWLYNCTDHCDQMFFAGPWCPVWGCGTLLSADAADVGYPKACRVQVPPARQVEVRGRRGSKAAQS